ncbi:DUF1178 family protein [Acetobacter orientalis]|uniref:DUF1178 domain-containing protein n=1 Tax=Acetobacter orientalis TaxID=146474 RepID=A0A252A4S5_9PROT|nr:DUF1178 family protein [Acetobacter orientalis]MCP1215554.1 DUF1178 family protein [Acetobacter orientalis]MCP1217593.1 DUF1178 family protein [Acetobacter orientalis]OUI84439.1 hypothetical protein HK12_00625 [Acetobacter orientalis]BBC78538.1 hypothetical protein AcetOrient_orf00296 [Acetobacter orientalis]GAN66671.1 hypothetical protein Abor_024_115 [Acetobacter orientalis]
MICYRLVCVHEHSFEGWYKDSATFARLQENGLLSCPDCGTSDVKQALMAPAIAKGRSAQAPTKEVAPAPQETPTQGSNVPDKVMVAFQKMRQAVEQNCENMGDRFATEAVRIHHGEAPKRGIYGNATERERTMLREEGVDVVAVPWVKRPES